LDDIDGNNVQNLARLAMRNQEADNLICFFRHPSLRVPVAHKTR
jgi:hypothetical protein